MLGLKGDLAMKTRFIILGRALALLLTYSLLFTLLIILAEDAHAPLAMTRVPSTTVLH